MKDSKAVYLKTNEMLEQIDRKNVQAHFMQFDETARTKKQLKLREELLKQIKHHKDFKAREKDFDWNQILKPELKSHCPFASISISYFKDWGAFLFVFDQKLSIGFDVEEKKRITKKLVSRIASKEEVEQSPFPSLLWTAKEASFKCLSKNPAVSLLSDCFISHWREKKGFYFFECQAKKIKKKASGLLCFSEDLVLAYAETT